MNLCEAWREAEVGEKIRRDGYHAILRDTASTLHMCSEDLEADDWEIVGRYPAPTEPGWYGYFPAGTPPMVIRVDQGKGLLHCNGKSVDAMLGKWGPRWKPPLEWTGDTP